MTSSGTDYQPHNEGPSNKAGIFRCCRPGCCEFKNKTPDKLQRRGKNRTKYYLGLFSKNSLLFLGAALFQAVVVIGLMVPIIALGEYSNNLVVNASGTTYDELSCEEKEDLRENIDSMNLTGIMEPEDFGRDRLTYVILFMCVVVYNLVLLVYALWYQSILEVTAFVVLNLLVTMYAVVQVYQFRSNESGGSRLTTVGYFALGNALFLMFMTMMFGFFFHCTYFEFGWKMYKRIRRSEWRFYYRWYQGLMSLGKLTVLFTIIFELGQCILFLDHCDPEFYLSILIMIVAIVIIIAAYFIVRTENKYLTIGLGISLILLAIYLIFKIVRFGTRSCPLCQLRNSLPFSEREQTFEHLIMLAAINLILTILTFLVLIVVFHNYKRGLRDQFRDSSCFYRRQRTSDTKLGPTGKARIGNIAEVDYGDGRPPSSSEFQAQPPLEDSATNSLHRSAQGYFLRQLTNPSLNPSALATNTVRANPSPLATNSLSVVMEEGDSELVQEDTYEDILQPTEEPGTPANATATPPVTRPQALQLLGANSTESAQH